MRRLSVLVMVAAVLVGAVALGRRAGTSAQDATPVAGPAITLLVEHNDAMTDIDLGAAGPSPGDLRVWGPNPLYDAADAIDTGATTQGTCVALNAAFDCLADETIRFPDGSTLEVQGVQAGGGAPSTRAIVGGSGRYLGAAGTVTAAPTADLARWTKVIALAAPGTGTSAQDATQPATAGHPLVGAWLVDSDADDEASPPSVTTLSADGTAVDAGSEGASAGTWEATGPRTATLALVGVFEEEGFAGSYFIRAEVDLDAAGDAFASPYTFTVVAADGTVLETGEVTARATRLRVPAAEAVGTPLAGFPTWTPAVPEAGAPEAATPAA